MPRDSELYLNDIEKAIGYIEQFTAGLESSAFADDELRLHSTLYNLMIIGEAIKNLPEDVQTRFPTMPWRDIARFRDKLVHHYFSIKPNIVWQIIEEDLPPLKDAVNALLQELRNIGSGNQQL